MVTLVSGIDGTWTNAGTFDAGEIRRADAAMFSSGGVARGLDVTVTASDVVRVEAGSWVIDGDETSMGAGVYRGGVSAQVSDYLEPRDATYGRIDLVVVRQYDPDVVGSHTNSFAAVEVLTGTPSANPSAPALPDLAIELARLDVPADGGGAVAVDTSQAHYATARATAAYLYVWHPGTSRSPGQGGVVGLWNVAEAAGGAQQYGSGGELIFGPAGLYSVQVAIPTSNSSGGSLHVALRDHATESELLRSYVGRHSSAWDTLTLAGTVRLSERQGVHLYAYATNTNSGSTEMEGGRSRFYLTATRVGD